MPEDVNFEGKGSSLEEAILEAMKQAPKQDGADILEIFEVLKFGLRLGGIAGVNEFWVIGRYRVS